MKKKVTSLIIISLIMSALTNGSAWAGTFDENYYILYNASPTPPYSRIVEEYGTIVDSLPQTNYVKSGVSVQSTYLSLDTYSHQQNYNWDSNNLDEQLAFADARNVPVLVQLNAGGWAGDVGLMHALADDTRTTMWDTNNWDMYRSIDQHNYMSYSRKNMKHYAFKKRNLQQIGRRIAEWRVKHPDQLVGVSLDSEDWQYVWDGTRYSDYSPFSIQEWKEWLTGTGMYDPVNGAYKGEARSPVFTSLAQFNSAMGTSFASWAAVDPPRVRSDGNPFWEEWSRWRTMLLKHHLQDLTNWLIEAGLPANRIYTHQNHVTSGSEGYYLTSSILTTADTNPGALGITLYEGATKDSDYMKQILGYNKNWGAPEYNPLNKTNKADNYNSLVATYEGGARYISPLSWNDPATSPYEIKNTAFEEALYDFAANYGNQRRPARFDIESPGALVYDLFTNFSSAVTSNTPSASAGTQTVGGVSKNGLFLHAPNTGDAQAVYSNVVLPAVTGGQRLNLALYSGLADGADGSDGYAVKVKVNSTVVFNGDYSQPHYSRWHRWEPAMIDLTAYAGQTVSITLASNKGKATSNYDWVVLGTPAIYLGTPDYTAPAQVTGAAASTVGSKRIQLSWNASSAPDTAEYKIYRSTTSGFTPSAATLVAFSSKPSYQDSGMNPSTSYYYKITAVDDSGNEGTPSSQVTAATAASSATAPAQLTGASAVLDSSKDYITLSWNASSATNLMNYRIYRSTKSSFPIEESYAIASIPGGGSTTFKDEMIFDNKTYYYQITACNTNDVCSVPSATVSVAAPGNTIPWSFNTSGNYEGWAMANDVTSTSVSGGNLSFTISGVDPYITSPANLGIRGKRSHVVKVVMRNNSPATSAQLFWTTAQNPSYSVSQMANIPIIASDTSSRTYWFDVGNMIQFTGVINQLRLDINGSSGSVNIDSIEILDGSEYLPWEFNQNGSYEGWTAASQIDSSSVTGGSLVLGFTNRTAPYLQSPDLLAVQAKPRQAVKMVMKNQTSAFQAKLQWITDSDTSWNDAKSVQIAINPSDAAFTEYTFPVGASAAWSGTVKQLRLSPYSTDGATAFSGTIEIDRISMGGSLPLNNVIPFAKPGNNKVELYWAQNRQDTGANVLRSTSYNGLYTKITDKPVSMHYTDTTAVNGQTYYYKLQYTNWLGNGLVSRPTGAIVPAAGTITQRESSFIQYKDGVGGWYYQSYNGSAYTPMTYVHDQSYNDSWSGGGAKISRVSQNPAVGADAVLKWVAPVTGTISIYGRPEYVGSNRTLGDGADLRIMKNSTQLWSATVTPASYATEAANHSLTISVTQGDAIYFHVNAKANATQDSVWWNPQIVY
ncbi:hypothetical protein ACFO9Q_22255 [Paenibacillus sp. GCM10023252]|uniref:hypothetical protein n=1 Tax=Paenibacillus sp. GCM10023252 TaxID=3252649 RepID=UPI00361E740A